MGRFTIYFPSTFSHRTYSRCCLWCFKHGRRGSTKLHGYSGVRFDERHSTVTSETASTVVETDDTANDTIDNNNNNGGGGDCGGDGVALTELGLSVS